MYYLDNVKIFLTLLVIFFHTSSAYGAEGGWYYIEISNELLSKDILTLINALCQSFFMGLFFFISAYFSPDSYDRKGFYLFIKGRTIKLLLPALFYFFFLNPLCIKLVQKETYIDSLGFYNMWFIMALFYFSLVYGILRKTEFLKEISISFPNKKKIFGFIIVMGLLNYIVRFFFPTNEMFIHDFSLGYFPQYILLFILGIIANRNKWLDQINKSTVDLYFSISLVSIITMPIVFSFHNMYSNDLSSFYGGLTIQALYYALWEPFTCVGIILKILYVFKNKLNYSTNILTTLSRTTYSIYIIHAPIIVILQLLFIDLQISILLKVTIVVILTSIISMVLSLILLKIPFLKKVLL